MKNHTVIKKYDIRIIEAPSDTVSIDDSARVRVSMYLDCTNKITRTETVVDTSGKMQKVILSVHGTVVEGPYKPMCPAKRAVKDFFIHFPKPGGWFIEASGRKNGDKQEPTWMISVR